MTLDPDTLASHARWKFLAGGGELGAIMRDKDWSGTPLGPLASWPQSLLTAVSVMLTAPQPAYVFWGTELAILYNDRGVPFVDGKHPECLGHSIRTVLKEAWPVLGPLVEGVMRTGTPVHLEDLLIPLERIGFLQDGYFTFSYIPIRNEAAEIGGILVIVNETTAQVLGERRLALIRELSLRAALCHDVGQVLSAASEVLAQAQSDVPFGLLYELRESRARLVVSAGIERGLSASPVEVELQAAGGWPLAAVRDGGERLVDDLSSRFGALPGGPSGQPAKRAFLLPLAGEREEETSHVLIAGLNPRYRFDEDARSFLQLLARQVATSITSTRALEQKTQRAAQLAELDRQKTEFFSNVSHEFRTPLTLMLGPVEDALDQGTGLHGETLASVHRNALRLLKLVNNLLDFSRLEAGRARATFRATDLAALTTDLASGFRSAIESAGLELEIACEPSASPTFVDVELWEKIVLNLLSNAFKFTFDGKIAVALRHEGDDAVLTVSDTGVGIPATELPHLFDRFHRVVGARARTHEGSGIGLALVSELAALHGGSVAVRSRVGVGTTFTVTIPRRCAKSVEPPTVNAWREGSTATKSAAYVQEALRWLPTTPTTVGAAETSPALVETAVSAEAQAARSKRILVVEDNADMRDYLTRLLLERWTVEAAADGMEALARATARVPDVIVSDMMMPGLDGISLVRALRRDERTREVPIILLSARADEQTTTDALDQGATDYMIKPFSARELIARVGAQLEIAAVQRQARQRLESFLMEAPAAIAVLRGPSLVYVLANARYDQIVGHRDIIGKAARAALPELSQQGVWDLVDRVYTSGVPFVADAFAVQLLTGGVGKLEPSYYNWVAQPTRTTEGIVDGVMIFAVDVTEQVRARQRVEQARTLEQTLRSEAEAARRVAEAASRAKDEFLAMLGHELRNPLAPIATALQLMRLRGDDGGEAERQIIERQVGHLEGLVSDLLDISRITQRKIELKRTRVEVSTVLREAIEMASPLLEQRRHHLEVRVARVGLAVDGDAGRLKQVFANLVTNAAKYTEPDGHIVVRAHRREDVIVVEVQDDGVGISPQMLPRVFDLFSQVPQSLARSQGGLGLGLSIVRSIVEMHDGRVRATSEGEGAGSTFAVELPAAGLPTAVASEGMGPDVPPDPLASGPQHASHRERILVVDDNQDAAEMLSEMLRAIGHETEMAYDGPHALRVASAFQPTVALLDIGLPVMDGYEVARRLRAEPGLAGIRLVAITGYGQDEDRRRSEAAGFDVHLVKPVQLGDLRRVLRAPDIESVES